MQFIKFVFVSFLLTTTSFAANLKDYSDYQAVPAWASLSFEALLKSDVISGTSDGKLKPNSTINRAEFVKILLEATDQNLIDPRPNSFLDVHPQHWFYQYVESAKALGWIDGYNDGNFRPGNTINRAEMAKLINKAFGVSPKTEPTDNHWYDADVRALATNNLLPYNVSKSAFGAGNNPTRAEAFEQMYRAMQFKFSGTAAPSNTNIVNQTQGESTGYDVAANFSLTMAVTPQAGRLDLKRPDSQAKKVPVTRGQQNVTIAKLEVVARNGDVQLSDLQFRRIGNGNINDFANLWLEVNNQSVTDKLAPSNDLVALNFRTPLTLKSNQITTINLKADISANATIGGSERFVLYLPDWINANTNEKIGLFPLGGSDVEIK